MKTQTDYMENMYKRYCARFRSFCKNRKECTKCEFRINPFKCELDEISDLFVTLLEKLEVFENEQKGPLKF